MMIFFHDKKLCYNILQIFFASLGGVKTSRVIPVSNKLKGLWKGCLMKKFALSIVIIFFLLLLGFTTPFQALAKNQITVRQEVFSISPDSGPSDTQTLIQITGQGFTPETQVFLNETPLLNLSFIDSTTLEATVPGGLDEGIYSFKAITGLEESLLPDAFTVTEGSGQFFSSGPYGGRTRNMAISPFDSDVVFVAVELAGLFRTVDGGLNWEHVFYSGANHIGSVDIVPNESGITVFIGGQDGLYRSDENGDVGTWSLVNITDQEIQPNDLAIAPTNPDLLYCAIGHSLFFSDDGGLTWVDRGTGLPGAPWRLAIDYFDADLIYASFRDGQLYKSTDGGQSWGIGPIHSHPHDGDEGILVLETDPYAANTIWYGTSTEGLYRSTDAGKVFSLITSLQTAQEPDGNEVDITNGFVFWSISFDPNQQRIYIGVSGPASSIFYADYSENDETAWLWTGFGLNNQGGADIVIAYDNPDKIYSSWAGIRKSTDGGSHWEWLSNGIAGLQFWQIGVSPHDPDRVIGVADSDGAFGSHDRGNTWESYNLALDEEYGSQSYRSIAYDPAAPGTIFLDGSGSIFISKDDGKYWDSSNNFPLPGPELGDGFDRLKPLTLAVHPQTPSTIYAGVVFDPNQKGGLYRSQDSGKNWVLVKFFEYPIWRVVFAPSNPEVIYLATGDESHMTQGDGIWRSDNGGETWNQKTGELANKTTRALAVHPNDPFTILVGAWNGPNTGDGIYRSMDGGDTWLRSSGLELYQQESKVPDIVFDPNDASIAYAATHGGLRVSFNGGQTWLVYPGEMGQLPVTALAAVKVGEDTRLYISTVGGKITEASSAIANRQVENIISAGIYVGIRDFEININYFPLIIR